MDVTVVITMLPLRKVVPDVVIVTVTVSLILGEVEPEVRLYIINPASMGNGAGLPLVLWIQSLVDKLPGPQQKDLPSGKGKMFTPVSLWTRRRK